MRLVTFDADTGALIDQPEDGITLSTGIAIASTVLPGMSIEAVGAAYDQFMDADGAVTGYEPRAAVTFAGADLGVGRIVKTTSHEGVMHSVLVRWPGAIGSTWHSPAEIQPVRS